MRKLYYGFGATAALLFAGMAVAPITAQAATITAIYGSGNDPNDWTTSAFAGGSVSLRAKERFSIPGDAPTNVHNWDGIKTYTQNVGHPVAQPARGRWNIEYSINLTTGDLNDYTYVFGIDSNPTAAVNFIPLDLMNNGVHVDHSLGTNATGQGGGIESANQAALNANLALNQFTVAQNSYNMAFFTVFPGVPFNPDIDGIYTFGLSVLDLGGRQIGFVTADVCVGDVVCPVAVPEPASLALFAFGLFGLGLARRKTA